MPQKTFTANHRFTSFLLACCALFSFFTAFTLAWSDFNQHATNGFAAGQSPVVCTVLLTKHENGKDGKNGAPDVRVQGAEFLLYRINEDASETQVADTATFTTNNEGQLVASGLAPGNYVFVETRLPYGYEFELDGGGQPITRTPFTVGYPLNPGEPPVIFTEVKASNRIIPQTLIVKKEVANQSTRPLIDLQRQMPFDFTITFSDGGSYECSIEGGAPFMVDSGGSFQLKHDEMAVFTNIPIGVQYTVKERPVDDFLVESKNSQGHITKTGAEAKFLNIYQDVGGAIYINKTISGDLADPNQDFTFQVDFEDGGTYYYTVNDGAVFPLTSGDTLLLKADQTATFGKLPLGLGYTVTEVNLPAGYKPTVNSVTGKATAIGSKAFFHNRMESADAGEPGALAFKKELAGTLALENPDKEFSFTVEFSDSGSYEYTLDGVTMIPFSSGETLVLKGGETATFPSIPADVEYLVTEGDSGENYIPSIITGQGVIVSNTTASLLFINEKNPEPEHIDPILKVRKSVEGVTTNKKFEITVKVDQPDGTQLEETFELGHDETKEFHLLSGAHYEVLEKDYYADGFIETTQLASGIIVGNEQTVVEAVITNTWYGPEMITIQGQKHWNRDANTGIPLPAAITVNLKNGDIVVATQNVVPDAQNEWHYHFEVPKYEMDGTTLLQYTLEEISVHGFKTVISPFSDTPDPSVFEADITNTAYAPLVQDVLKVKKTVEGENAPADSVFQFILTGQDGLPMPENSTGNTKTIDLTGTGEASFGPLTFINPGVYGYTVREINGALAGYTYDTSSYTATFTVADNGGVLEIAALVLTKNGEDVSPVPESFAFVNGYTEVVPIDIRVQKVIVENVNVPHPTCIEVQLYHDGLPVSTPVTLCEDNGWQQTWTGLDSEGDWTVDELVVPAGYTKEITGSEEDGFIITNTASHNDDTVIIQGEKRWEHKGNSAANQPKEITVYVKQDDFVVAQKQVTEQDGWRYSFELPKFAKDDSEIQYTIEEKPVDGYRTSIKGYNLLNTYTGKDSPQTNEGTKLWLWTGIFFTSAALLLVLLGGWKHHKRKKRFTEIQRKMVYKRRHGP